MTRHGRVQRRLQRAHFAFMRALVQGLDERASWERYLRIEGEHADLRTVRRTITWIRDEFAAAARREHRPGTARLILLDSRRVPAAPVLPSLEAFAAERGMEDFSESDLLEAYQDAYPDAGRAGQGGKSRRARLIERQLEALHWLQGLVAQDPRPGDWVGVWLNPSLAMRLEGGGISTLGALVERINGSGARWSAGMRGVGERKAARVVDWLRANEEVLGLRVVEPNPAPPLKPDAAGVAASVSPATALRPLEWFVVPEHRNGAEGHLRAERTLCRLDARTDQEAIHAWVASLGATGSSGELSATQRSYRREAERLLLWAVLERDVAVSSLTTQDARAFGSFLAAPPPHWCGPRHHARGSAQWRPMEGPLRPASLRQSLVILRSLFTFLLAQRYVVANPFAELTLPHSVRHVVKRTLTVDHWTCIERSLLHHTRTAAQRRLRRALRWLYATGLRPSELIAAQCDHLIGPETSDGRATAGWRLAVVGRCGRRRHVPVPEELIRELGEELMRQGREEDPRGSSNCGVHLLARFSTKGGAPEPWSASAMQQAIKGFLGSVADQLGAGAGAGDELRQATAHWLRHSHAAHVLRQGELLSPRHRREAIEAVRTSLGHARRSTTQMYITDRPTGSPRSLEFNESRAAAG